MNPYGKLLHRTVTTKDTTRLHYITTQNDRKRAPYASVNRRPRPHDNLMHPSCLAVFEILTHSLFFSLAHTLTKTARHGTKTTTNHTTKWSYSRAARSTWITIHETLHSTCPYSHVHKLYSSIMKCLKNHQYFKKLRDVASTVTQSP